MCKDCGKTFKDMMNTPFSGSRYPEKRVKYIELMVEGYTLPKIAERLDIHIFTAFYWRHKILKSLGSIGFNKLQGILKSDKTFFGESMKGREVTHRKAKSVEKRTKREGFPTLKWLLYMHYTVMAV